MSSPYTPADFNPKTKGEKFSPNLYRFILKWWRKGECLIYKNSDGCLYIGRLDSDGWFYGSRLMAVLCGIRGSMRGWAHSPKAVKEWKLREVKGFWDCYAEIGRCAIDPEHRQHFQNAVNRYKVTGARSRCCSWCNTSQRMTIRKEVREHEVWTNSNPKKAKP